MTRLMGDGVLKQFMDDRPGTRYVPHQRNTKALGGNTSRRKNLTHLSIWSLFKESGEASPQSDDACSMPPVFVRSPVAPYR